MADAATLTSDQPFGAAFVFNSVHDQARPLEVLSSIRSILEPGGTFLMNEPRISSNLEDNIGNPVAPMTYAISLLHCMTVSLAEGGAGLGTGWGEQVALGCWPTPVSALWRCTTPLGTPATRSSSRTAQTETLELLRRRLTHGTAPNTSRRCLQALHI